MLVARKSPEGQGSALIHTLRPASTSACDLWGPLFMASPKGLDSQKWHLLGPMGLGIGYFFFLPVLVPMASFSSLLSEGGGRKLS